MAHTHVVVFAPHQQYKSVNPKLTPMEHTSGFKITDMDFVLYPHCGCNGGGVDRKHRIRFVSLKEPFLSGEYLQEDGVVNNQNLYIIHYKFNMYKQSMMKTDIGR